MTSPRSATPPPSATHLRQRRRHPAPWALTPGAPPADPDARRGVTAGPAPVFVDDSGRRRRAGRWIGGGLGALVLGYVALVGMTFAGVPLAGRLAPPGVEQLSRPTSDQGVSVTPGAQESPMPPADDVTVPPVEPVPAGGPVAPAPDEGAGGTAAGSSTTTGVTTTTAPAGNGATTSVPGPNSTAPERTRPTGPPAEPPGRP